MLLGRIIEFPYCLRHPHEAEATPPANRRRAQRPGSTAVREQRVRFRFQQPIRFWPRPPRTPRKHPVNQMARRRYEPRTGYCRRETAPTADGRRRERRSRRIQSSVRRACSSSCSRHRPAAVFTARRENRAARGPPSEQRPNLGRARRATGLKCARRDSPLPGYDGIPVVINYKGRL